MFFSLLTPIYEVLNIDRFSSLRLAFFPSRSGELLSYSQQLTTPTLNDGHTTHH